jgi:4-hydroxy-3-polyprenylbenzoate decarboxylase
MAKLDLRKWLDEVEKMGELRTLTDVEWDLELGAITEMLAFRDDGPATVFDQVKGYPPGFRVAVNTLGSPKRRASVMGISPNLERPLEQVQAWREKTKNIKMIPPQVVSDGPVMENVLEGKDIDLLKFPVPRWHPLDGGRYIGTGSMTITRDPEDGWVNLGTYRVMVHNENTLGFYISPGKHGRIHREKCLALGVPCKVTISFGHHPRFFMVSAMKLPEYIQEYELIGGLSEEPVEVIEGELSGLPFPANSEIVIEGEASFDEQLVEGPFGEFTGYYGSASRLEPVIKVKRLMYRNDPIILGSPPVKPPSETNRAGAIVDSAIIWDEMERAGVPDIKGVWNFPEGAARFFTVVSIKQRYPGHARQAGLVAAGAHACAYMGRYVLVVDEDVDPTSLSDVLWVMSSRSDPKEAIEIVRRCWSSPLDPIIKKGEPAMSSRAIIDATRPYEWKEDFPPINAFPKADLDAAEKKWGKLLFD